MKTDFEQHMASHGYQPPEIIADGNIHRFNVGGRKDKTGWYVYFSDGPVPGGAFGNWAKKNETHKWSGKGNGKALTYQQKEALKAEIEKAKQAREKERLELQKKAAERAANIWKNAKPARNDHPYLKKKGVLSDGLKIHEGALVVPVYDPLEKTNSLSNFNLVSLQFISANRRKRFLKHGKKKGCFFIVNNKKTRHDNKLFMAEGWATAATVHQATGYNVMVCFDASNLKHISDSIGQIRAKYETIVCADNDQWTNGNPGLTNGREAAKENHFSLVYPQFKDVSSKPTDFNDLCLLEGIDVVKNQIKQAGRSFNRPKGITASELIEKEFPEPRWAVPGLLPEGLNIMAGKPKTGKSIMAANLGLAISTGGKALGFVDVDSGTVIYLALEDTQRRLQSRIKQMLCDGRVSEKLIFFTEWPQDGLKILGEEIQRHGDVRLVIIDTLKLFKQSPMTKGKNIYDVDYETITPIKKLAEHNSVSILLIHHLRKSEADDIFDTFSGSLGLTGAADGLLALARVTGQADAELHINGRDVEAAEYALKFHPDILSWQILGKADEVKSTSERQRLFDALKNADEPLGPKDLAEITGLKNHYIRNALPILIKEGSAIKSGYGKYIYGDRWGEPQHGGDTIYNNSFYKDTEDTEGTEDTEDSYSDKASKVSSGGTVTEDTFSDNKNNKLSESVLTVPGVYSVENSCKTCKACDKASMMCHYSAAFKGKPGKGIPCDIAIRNCPLDNK